MSGQDLCVRGIDFASFNDFSIGYWKCSDSVIFLVFTFNHEFEEKRNYETYVNQYTSAKCISFPKKPCRSIWQLYVKYQLPTISSRVYLAGNNS